MIHARHYSRTDYFTTYIGKAILNAQQLEAAPTFRRHLTPFILQCRFSIARHHISPSLTYPLPHLLSGHLLLLFSVMPVRCARFDALLLQHAAASLRNETPLPQNHTDDEAHCPPTSASSLDGYLRLPHMGQRHFLWLSWLSTSWSGFDMPASDD